MAYREPSWVRLVLDPLLKVGEGLLMGLITVAGLVVWVVLVIFSVLFRLGGRRAGKDY